MPDSRSVEMSQDLCRSSPMNIDKRSAREDGHFLDFEDVIGTDEFYQLPGKQLLELISSEQLQVSSEEQVFEAVVKWVRFDLPARRQLFRKADHVCLNLVDKAK
ncbi:BTB And Kelch, partial [Teladorsagia circumcincta]